MDDRQRFFVRLAVIALVFVVGAVTIMPLCDVIGLHFVGCVISLSVALAVHRPISSRLICGYEELHQEAMRPFNEFRHECNQFNALFQCETAAQLEREVRKQLNDFENRNS